MRIYNEDKKLYLLFVLPFLMFFSMKTQAQTPGGTGITTEVWLSADKVNGPGVALPEHTQSVHLWKSAVMGQGRDYKENTHANATYNYTPAFYKEGNLMNFQPYLFFWHTNAKLINDTKLLDPWKAYYVFHVSRTDNTTANRVLFAFNANNGTPRYNNVGWYNGAPYLTLGGAASSQRKLHQGNGKLYGINATVIPNSTTSGALLKSYMNGVANTTNFNTGTLTMSSSSYNMSVIGGGDNDYTDPFTGELQELIILSAPQGTNIDEADLNKVTSYLALKYGITLEAGNYTNSAGVTVWDRLQNTGYTNNVFGIGRDDANGLYQKQATSSDKSELVMYLSDLVDLNIDNTGVLNDGDYLLLGSNSAKGTVSYAYKPGEVSFVEGTLDEEINFRHKLTFKAQTSTSRTSFEVKLNIKEGFVLVSKDENFDPAQTRIYKAGQTIRIEDKEYISSAVYAGVPGGIKDNLELWLASDALQKATAGAHHSDVTVWEDLSDNRRNFVQSGSEAVPRLNYNGMNFNPTLDFYREGTNITATDQQRKLISAEPFSVEGTKSYYTFWVSNVNTKIANSYTNVFSFNGNNYTYNNNGWYIASSIPQLYWSTAGTATRHTITGKSGGIGTVIRPNITGVTQSQYINGIAGAEIAGRQMALGNYTAVIGNSTSTGTYYPFFGDVQEIIVYSGISGKSIPNENLQKIHSYLALKYGITLEGQDLITSKNLKIWDATGTKNTGYQKNVFGIGYDKPSELYVKQATSADYNIYTAFVGNELADLNRNNTGTIAEDVFVMFGSNGATQQYQKYAYKPEETTFAEGALSEEVNFRTEYILKAQLTNATEYTLRMTAGQGTHIIVSSDETFNPINTRVYQVDRSSNSAEIRVKDGEYISFILYEGVPGGLINDLDLWLSADFLEGKLGTLPDDGEDVKVWKDLSQQKRDFAQYFPTTGAAHSVPRVSYDGLNFNPTLDFYKESDEGALTPADNQRKLVSDERYPVDATKAYYTFWVSEVDMINTSRGTVFTYNSYYSGYDNHGWYKSGENPFLYTSTGGTYINANTDGRTSAIHSIVRPNVSGSANTQYQYINGKRFPISGAVMGNPVASARAVIGTSNLGTDYPFYGNMQEIITYTGDGGTLISDTEIQKIHSYLALKYGITLEGQDLITSKELKVWDGIGAKNEGYKQHVFGLGRDKPSEIHIKQATSSSFRSIVAYVGDELAELNKDNPVVMEEDVFAMFGSNGIIDMIDYRYNADENHVFANGVTLDEDINFREGTILKTQLTNTSEFNLNMSGPGIYVLVSPNDPTFAPENTRLYKMDVNAGAAKITVNDGDYICFAYYAKGPGGVAKGLRMWLDAGVEEHITVNSAGDVTMWRDKSRISNTVYTYQAVNSANKAPGFNSSSTFANFHPSVHFRKNGEYLTTFKGPATVAGPKQYTAYNVVYNDFVKADRSYFMSWGSKLSDEQARRPVFGMISVNGRIVGRYFENGGSVVQGNVDLFKVGATSINIQTIDAINRKLTFESNGVKEELVPSSGITRGSRMNGVGVIGGGSYSTWQLNGVIAQSIFFERLLTQNEQERVYSYLGMKYASTLRMTDNAFNYIMSDHTTSVWDGTQEPFKAYHNNVAGLVRDDVSDLYNNVAQSTDANAILKIMIRGHDMSEGQGAESLLEDDLTYMFWGHNGNTDGVKDLPPEVVQDLCGSITKKTGKIWLVNKSPKLDKLPVTIRFSELGELGMFGAGYEVVLLVADSPEKIENNKWDMAIPSSFLTDIQEQSIDFTFLKEKTYIAFGIKTLPGSCETCGFEGVKKVEFDKNTWFPHGILENTVDLGDNFTVNIKNSITAPALWYSKYPRFSSAKSLQLRRRGEVSPVMVTEITPSVAAAAKFQIFDIDRDGNNYKEVVVYGECEGNKVMPTLTMAYPKRSSYVILGNKAQAKITPTSGYTSDVGKLNVVFDYPVDKIVIEESAISNKVGAKATQYIGISPIEFSCPAPRPPYSEAGIAFSKQATPEVTLCGEGTTVDYTFRIYSGNCDRKNVNITDTLPENMYWDLDLIAIDDIAITENTKITISENKRILNIEGMMVPGAADPFIFTAQALFAENAQPGIYENQAWLRTSLIINDIPTEIEPEPSSDYHKGERQKSETVAIDGGVKLKAVTVDITNTSCYRAESEILVTLTINNPNNQVTDMFFDINYNDEFSFINNSLSSSITGIGNTPLFEKADDGTNVSGYFYLEGFTLPTGESKITFKVQAPKKEYLVGETDREGNPLDWDGNILIAPFDPDKQAKVDLVFDYGFTTDMDDPCVSSTFFKTDGEIMLPFCLSKDYIITNMNVTGRIKR